MNKNRIRKKINDIHLDLDARYNEIETLAMFTGASGALVFYYMLYQLDGEDQYKKRFYEIAEDIFERVNEEEYSKTYCDGLTGVAFALEFFRKKGWFSQEDVGDALAMFDGIILDVVAGNSSDKEGHDFLHGALGCLFYLNSRVQENESIKEELVKHFEVVATVMKNEIQRETFGPKDIPQANCGLAHGTVSYIIVFSKFMKNFPENKIVKESLKLLVDHQLSFMSKDPATLSLFPSIAGDKEDMRYNIVLGWCYGDQTVAIGLYIANEILQEKYIEEQAYEIAMHTAKRNTVIKSSKTEVTDAGLCHGVSSVALNNNLLHQLTGESVFAENYEYFTNAVLERGDHPSTGSGFRRFFGDGVYEDVLGFLDGTIGVGVFLIDTLLEEEVGWEEFFILK